MGICEARVETRMAAISLDCGAQQRGPEQPEPGSTEVNPGGYSGDWVWRVGKESRVNDWVEDCNVEPKAPAGRA